MSTLTVNDQYLWCKRGDSIVKGTHDKRHFACRLLQQANEDPTNPPVELTGTTANADEVFGEIMEIEDDMVRIKWKGILTLRTAPADTFLAADIRLGAASSTTRGVVLAHGDAAGSNNIVGGRDGQSVSGQATNLIFVAK